jgi:hypothetical protein
MLEFTASSNGKYLVDIEKAVAEIDRLVSKGNLSGTNSNDTGEFRFQIREVSQPASRKFCVPMETADRSSPQAVAAKLAVLINVLDDLTPSVISGELNDVAARLHAELLRRLRAEGWRVTTHKTKSAWVVRPPA